MAGFVQNLLKDASSAFFGNDYLRDFQHASKTFRPDNYTNAPKFKFLFHVYFDINTDIGANFLTWDNKKNLGLAVKTIQLPKYSFDLHTMNQYNRKRIVQTKIKYDPVNITLHDDNGGMIRKLWQSYFSYYYKDINQTGDIQPTNKTGANAKNDINGRTQYDSSIAGNDDWGFIGESTSSKNINKKIPFFRAINIYGFNQHNFILYRLINPMIESFAHDTYSYSDSGVMEHQMTINYETVKYYEGAIDGRKPDNIVQMFGREAEYDRTLSPIARPGSNASILGQGGLIDGAGGIMEDIASGNIFGAVQKAGAMKNTFKNPANILNIAKSEALTLATNSIQNVPNRNSPFQFPTDASTMIQNAPKNIVSGAQNAVNTLRK